MDPKKLPVYQEKGRILAALEMHQVIVVESPTGSGKTTQLPLILHEAGYGTQGVIGVTQPRRIAAVSVCEYIAQQLGSPVPGLVGYKMRFDDLTLPETRMKIMTDGILLQEIKNDTLLSKYSVIIVDEAHERSLNIDFILGLLKGVLEERPEFRVIISSATINPEVFSEYFNGCPIVHIETSVYPVTVIHDPPLSEGSAEAMIAKIGEIVQRNAKGKKSQDILIFLSGEKDIKDTITLLSRQEGNKKLMLIPLYGRLSKEEQEQVFIPTPAGKTKVVVATNIAETSVTIDGITVVIDSGLAKLSYYNPRTFTSSLIESPISRASCNQRKGRAGRTQPGTCYRLYSKKDFDDRPLFTTEEIYRTDLSEVVLRMAEIGIKDYESFDFISSPGRQGIHGAVETLHLLGALNPQGLLSDTGKMMARFPLLPRHSRMIVEAILQYPQVLEETIIATSFLTTHNPFLLPQGEEMEARRAHHTFQDPLGDFVSYLKIYRQFLKAKKKEEFCTRYYLDMKIMTEIVNIKTQLEEIVGEMGIPISSGGELEDYLCAVSRGLIQFVCVRTGRGEFRSLTAERIYIHPGSVMFRENPQYIVAGEIVKTSRTFARSVSPLQKAWLKRVSPELAESFRPASNQEIRSGRDRAGREEKGKGRDTTWQLMIGRHSFTLEPYKGNKKLARLPWESLKPALKELRQADMARYSKLRAVVIIGDRELMKGAKLNAVLKVMQQVNPETDTLQGSPPKKGFKVPGDQKIIRDHLDQLLQLAPLSRKKRESNQLGFVSLEGNGSGDYWFRVSKSYSGALEYSLAALEVLADELKDEKDNTIWKGINKAYRRLTTLLDSL